LIGYNPIYIKTSPGLKMRIRFREPVVAANWHEAALFHPGCQKWQVALGGIVRIVRGPAAPLSPNKVTGHSFDPVIKAGGTTISPFVLHERGYFNDVPSKGRKKC
jgi:hypothetical protein